MDNVLLAIGPFVFYATAPSFRMLRNSLEPRWSEQDRVSRAPAGQFIGAANTTVDVNGSFYPDSVVEQVRFRTSERPSIATAPSGSTSRSR